MSNLFKVIVTDNKDGNLENGVIEYYCSNNVNVASELDYPSFLMEDEDFINLTIREAIEVAKDYSENTGLYDWEIIQVINLKDNKIYFEFYQGTDFEDIDEDDLIQIEGVK
jgi:hypothetical protein